MKYMIFKYDNIKPSDSRSLNIRRVHSICVVIVFGAISAAAISDSVANESNLNTEVPDAVKSVQEDNSNQRNKAQDDYIRKMNELAVSVEPFEGDPEKGWVVSVLSGVSYATEKDLVSILSIGNIRVLYLGGAFGDESMKQIAEIETLHELGINETAVTDQGIRSVENLKSLNMLNISESYSHSRKPRLTDSSLESIAKLGSLRSLILSGPGFTVSGIKHLQKLDNLNRLDLSLRTPFDENEAEVLQAFTNLTHLNFVAQSDSSLEHLVPLKQLKSLSVRSKTYSGEGVPFLKQMTHLESLKVYNWKIETQNDLEQLILEIGKLTQLKHLNLSNNQISDKHLLGLLSLNSLNSLHLENSNVTNEGVMSLAILPNLKLINVRGTKVNPEGKATFHGVAPDVVVFLKP